MSGNNVFIADSIRRFEVLAEKTRELEALVAHERRSARNSMDPPSSCIDRLTSLVREIGKFFKQRMQIDAAHVRAINYDVNRESVREQARDTNIFDIGQLEAVLRYQQELNDVVPEAENTESEASRPTPHESMLRVRRLLSEDCFNSNKSRAEPETNCGTIEWFSRQFYLTVCPSLIAKELGTDVKKVYAMLNSIKKVLSTIVRMKGTIMVEREHRSTFKEFLTNKVARMFKNKFLFHVFMKHHYGYEDESYVEYTQEEVQLYILFASCSQRVMQMGLL